MAPQAFAPTFVVNVGSDERGNWVVTVPAAPDLAPVTVAASASTVRVAELVRLVIAEHFDIPEAVVKLDMGKWR